MNAKRGALLGSALTATVMLAIAAPGAESGSGPKLKITTVDKDFQVLDGATNGDSARCPSDYHVTGGGVIPDTEPIAFLGRSNARQYHATIENQTGQTINVSVQAICVKGANGLQIVDDGSGFPG
jgi:hypothetical protein